MHRNINFLVLSSIFTVLITCYQLGRIIIDFWPSCFPSVITEIYFFKTNQKWFGKKTRAMWWSINNILSSFSCFLSLSHSERKQTTKAQPISRKGECRMLNNANVRDNVSLLNLTGVRSMTNMYDRWMNQSLDSMETCFMLLHRKCYSWSQVDAYDDSTFLKSTRSITKWKWGSVCFFWEFVVTVYSREIMKLSFKLLQNIWYFVISARKLRAKQGIFKRSLD